MVQDRIAAEVTPAPGKGQEAARALQRLGFRVLHIGPTISVEGSSALWTSHFGVTFQAEHTRTSALTGEETAYQQAKDDGTRIPADMQSLIKDVSFVRPPELF
jgi:hypothetical protein